MEKYINRIKPSTATNPDFFCRIRSSFSLLLARNYAVTLNQLQNILLNRAYENNGLLFFASMPKSASTYLSKTIANKSGWKWCHLSDRNGGCEFDIYGPKLLDVLGSNVVVQQHTLATEGNLRYLFDYGAKIIVTYRDFFSVIRSLRRHFLSESMRWPFFGVPVGFEDWDAKSQVDFIIEYCLPWLVHFFVSWSRLKSKGYPLLFIDYNDVKEHQFNIIKHIMNCFDLKDISEISSQQKSLTNFDLRKANETDASDYIFTSGQLERIFSVHTFYKDVNFHSVIPEAK